MRMGLGLGINQQQGGGGGNSYGNDFVMTVRTTAPAETVTFPCGAGTYNAVIDWGDAGPTSTITAFDDADLAHAYAAAGDHTVRISGTFPNLVFNNAGDCLKIITVEQMGRVGWTSVASSFYGCANMTRFVAGNTDLAGDKSFLSTFRSCSALTTLDLSSLWSNGVRPVNLGSAFFGVSSLTSLNLSGFDLSQNASMGSAVRAMTALTTLLLPDNAVTTTCTNLQSMAFSSAALETFNTTGWDVSAVTDFANAFRDMGTLNIDISGFRFDALASNTVFMSGTTLATAQYDAALIEWDGIDAPNSLSWNFGTSKFTGGGAAEAAKNALVATDLWVITDGGAV